MGNSSNQPQLPRASMGAGSGPAALQLAARIQDAKARAEKVQHARDREVVMDQQHKDNADRADQRILDKHIDQQIANQRLLIAETEARTKRDKAFAQDREEPAYRIAIHGLNVFDPDFPSHLSAVNARYPNISVTDKGQVIASSKMADAGMKFGPHGIEYIPGKLQDKYRKAEETLGFHELRDLATYSRSTGKFLEIDAFEVEQKVLEKRVEAARKLAALPGESVRLSDDGKVAYSKTVPVIPQVNPEKADAKKEKADAARDSRHVVVLRMLKTSLEKERANFSKAFTDVDEEAKAVGKTPEKYKADKLKEIDGKLGSINEQLKGLAGLVPPAPKDGTPQETGAAPITPKSWGPESWGPESWVPESLGAPPASTTPTAPAKRIPFKDRLKEPPSQPQASAAPYSDPLADIQRFVGGRDDVESDPAVMTEFNSVTEAARPALQSLGYDDDSISEGFQAVLDGHSLDVQDGEAATVDTEGVRTPLKKAASEAVASIDSSSTAS